MITTDSGESAFLGVTRSLTGRRWRFRPADPAITRAHQQGLGLAEPLARAMASRGVGPEEGEMFLRPTLRGLFPDPSSFADMDRAASVLVDSMIGGRNMVVFADYDVDGACSAALLIRWFRHMGRDLPLYVPDRIKEGYGPSPEAFRHLRASGADLVITVDCGAAAYDALAVARDIGLDVVVIDHHLMDASPFEIAALVNPNRPDCGSGQGVLAAAGVSFVLLVALTREARARGLFLHRSEPDVREWLDLAAMGAICDVTRLVGFNRALAAHGLRVMSEWRNLGLAALMDTAGLERRQAGVFEAGFILGPRVNAGGRIGRADLGARLLSTDDPAEAADLAGQLDALNIERKTVEREILEAATRAIEQDSNFDPHEPVVIVSSDDWHPGVVGIVAGRLRERYRKPAIVLGIDRNANVAKGSGRSQPGVNLGEAVRAAYAHGLLLTGGGHQMAAGLTMRPERIPDLRDFLAVALSAQMDVVRGQDALDVDVLISPGGANVATVDEFARLAPFGQGNPEPIFAMANVNVEHIFPMKGGHVRCDLTEGGGMKVRAVAWRVAGSPIGERLMAGGGGLHMAGRLRRDSWNGRVGVQFEIEDVADRRRVSEG